MQFIKIVDQNLTMHKKEGHFKSLKVQHVIFIPFFNIKK